MNYPFSNIIYKHIIIFGAIFWTACGSNNSNKMVLKDQPAYHNPIIQPLTDQIVNNPDSANLYFQRSVELDKVNEATLAIEDLRKAVSIEPDNVEYVQSLGIMLLNEDKYDDALNYLNKSAQKSPNEMATRLLITEALIGKKDFANAQHILDSLTKLTPNHPGVLYYTVRLKAAEGDTNTAISLSEKIIAASPSYYDAHMQLANLYSRKGNEKAIDMYQKTFSLDSTDMMPWEHIIEFYQRKNLINQEKGAIKKAILLNTGFVYGYLAYAKILIQQDSLDPAIRQLTIASKITGNHKETYYLLGQCFEKEKNKTKAIENYNQSLSYDPNYQPAINALKTIR